MLTPLQEEVAALIAALAEAKDFALAGGAALIMREQIERRTRDLDFFGLSAAAVDRLVPAAEQALRRSGFDVERVLSGAGFAQLVVQGFGEQTEVDLAADARLFPAELGRAGIPLLSSEELAVDKVLAVFGRAEARDFIDLMAVETQFDLGRLFTLAAEKDGVSIHGCSRTWSVVSRVSVGPSFRSMTRPTRSLNTSSHDGGTPSRSPGSRHEDMARNAIRGQTLVSASDLLGWLHPERGTSPAMTKGTMENCWDSSAG